jgi:hypothetical protein
MLNLEVFYFSQARPLFILAAHRLCPVARRYSGLRGHLLSYHHFLKRTCWHGWRERSNIRD